MDSTLIIVGATIVLLIIIAPALFFFRKSTDVRIEGDSLILRYPFSKEAVDLSKDLKQWNLQEAYFFRLGKVYAINLELKNGKRKAISSRFNYESFQKVLLYLESTYSAKREAASKR